MGERLSNALKKEKKEEKDITDIETNISKTSRSDSSALRFSTEPKEESKEEKKYTPKLCEQNAKYQKYLKYMVKNNYISLSYEELCSYFIQICWRKYYISHNSNKNKYKMIEIIYSNDINKVQNEKIFNFFNNKNFPLKIYNLKKYSKLEELINKLGGEKILPSIFINGYYIGSYDELIQIEEIINKILNYKFENICLNCFIYKIDNNQDKCPFCNKNKYFFALNEEKYNIWDNRK